MKWVPIPAEELRAVVDAQQVTQPQGSAHARLRSHQQSQNRAQEPISMSASPSGSTSGRDSQNCSRVQSSVTRERRPGSQTGLASQSRTQSRNDSLQSSPRHFAVRRRLPEEVPDALGAPNRSLRTSRAGSPQFQMSYTQDMSGSGSVIVTLRPGGPLAPLDARSESSYYAAVQHFGSHTHTSYTPSPAMSSPVAPSYHLSLAHYPLPPMSMPSTYSVGVLPYSMYPPYTYGYGQPYVFWGGSSSGQHSQNISQTHSPLMYTIPLGNTEALLISPLIAPVIPPPGGFDLPVNAVEVGQAQSPELARPRVLNFGSIDIASSIASEAPSGEQSIASNNNVQPAGINDRIVLTDSAVVHIPPSSTTLESQFPAFSVGLALGDPGPSRK